MVESETAVAVPCPPCTVQLVAFDFTNKKERSIELDDVSTELEAGSFLWLDLNVTDPREAREILARFAVDDQIVDPALNAEASTQHARYDACLHLVISGCRERGHQFDLERVDVVIAERFLLTIHRGPVVFLDAVRRDYRSDFVNFARSPSFLLYEIWDHLLENYLAIQKRVEERVEALQNRLRGEHVTDDLFASISELGADLLHFRKILLPARAVLADLSTRRSKFISETTQGFLANMVGTVEHVLQDLLVDRDLLSESLNLYMSLVSHRTNEVMKRLTVVSVIFLPLTFLVGVYGMNFEVLPELKWHYGYLFFWLIVIALVAGLLYLMRRARLL
jgi:magnesium transporter